MEQRGCIIVISLVLLGGCAWDEFKERSRMVVVGASDAVIHAPKRSSGPYYITVQGRSLMCQDNGVTVVCN